MAEENEKKDLITVANEEKSHKVKDFFKKHKTVIIEAGIIAAALGAYAAVSAIAENGGDSDGDSTGD